IAGGPQCFRAEQRRDVVRVHDLRLIAPYGPAELRRRLATREHRDRGAGPAAPAPERAARTLEELRGVSARAQQLRDLGHRPLLAAGLPVAVVQEQYGWLAIRGQFGIT